MREKTKSMNKNGRTQQVERRGEKKTENNYIKPTFLYEEAARRYNELMSFLGEKEKSLAEPPKGRIHILKSGKKVQFYVRKDRSEKSGKYISKKEKSLIKKYVQYAYDEKTMKLLISEADALLSLINHYKTNSEKIRQAYSDNPDEVKDYIDPIDVSDEEYLEEWIKKPFTAKEVTEDLPCYETFQKERVRSKSELNIANTLSKMGIPYKYECPLALKNGAVIYPDFTVLNVRKRKQIFWEHRGMMDNEEYATHAVLRIKNYVSNGYCLGRDLIITEETSTGPLGTDEIMRVITTYLK